MGEQEICILYRGAKDKGKELQILAELSCRGRIEIIGILLKNGEKVPPKEIKKLYKRLDVLENQIAGMEKEHREIVSALTGGKSKEQSRRDEHGNRVHRNGCVK